MQQQTLIPEQEEGGQRSIFMYRQSDRFSLPVFMMGFGDSEEQATAPLPLFKQSANKRRSQEDTRVSNSVGKEYS
jgi:hypothetical protein